MNPSLKHSLSRRTFLAVAAAGVVARPGEPLPPHAYTQAGLTAQQVVDRIRQTAGVEWKTDTVDTFKAGNPETMVTGVATTAMATLAVLQQAVQGGANLVITCEPTFYSKSDTPAPIGTRRGAPASGPDPVFTAKNDFIRSNGLVVWRFSDHWRVRTPDPFSAGLTDALGWQRFRAADDVSRVQIPAMPLERLAAEIKARLRVRGGIRVVGDPGIAVQKIGLLAGTTAIQATLKLLPQVDAIVAGEVREWESVEYVRDKVRAGEKKSLILVGRVVSEDPGMSECAEWLKTVVPEIRTTWIPAGDPYWRPA